MERDVIDPHLRAIANKHEQKTNSSAYYDAGLGGNDPGGPGNIYPNNRYRVVADNSHIFNATTAATANAGFHHWNQGALAQGLRFRSNFDRPAR